MSKQIYRLIKNIIILGALLVICDRVTGSILDHLYYKQNHGDDYTTIYAMTKTSDSILIFGSSRASHHYKARQIAGATGMSCFNAGRDDMGIPYARAILSSILQRHKPRAIILDVLPLELSGDKTMAYQRMETALLPLAARYPALDEYIALAGNAEVFKRKASGIYAYNSRIGMMIQNSYTHFGHSSDMGYEPLIGAIDTVVYKKSIWKDMDDDKPVDKVYDAMLDSIISTAKERAIRLAVIVSPFYFYNNFSDNEGYVALKRKMAQHPEVAFLDFTNDPVFTGQPALFRDDVHLNDTGATIYTRMVVAQLQQRGLF